VTLKSKAQFAEILGISRAAVTKACKPGKPLANTLVDGRNIDIEHPDAIEYADSRDRTGRMGQELEIDLYTDTNTNVDVYTDAEADGDEFLVDDFEKGKRSLRELGDKNLNWIIDHFGSAEEFRNWTKAVHELEKTQERRIKNFREEGKLVSQRLIKLGIIDPIEEAFRKMLVDGARTMSIRIHGMVLGGRKVHDVEEYIRETVGSYIRPAKVHIGRTLENLSEEGEDAI